MTVHLVRESPQPGAPAVEVAVVGMTPGFTVRFVADDHPALYVQVGDAHGIVAGSDLPDLVVALAELAAAYGHDVASPSPGVLVPHP